MAWRHSTKRRRSSRSFSYERVYTLLSCSEWEEKREIKLDDGDDKQPLVARPPRKLGRQAGCATHATTRRIIYTLLCCRESQFIYAQLPCTFPRVNNEATGCRRPHRREPSMTDRATLMARITRPVSPSHPPAILWQPTRPTPLTFFYDSLFKNK